MVDKEEIRLLLKKNFVMSGEVKIHDDGVVDIVHAAELANIRFLRQWKKLPVTFGRIEGTFAVGEDAVETLEGFPRWVAKDLFSSGLPRLKTLDHAPDYIGQGWLLGPYKPDMPLLRTLNAHQAIMVVGEPDEVNTILNRYRGQGKKGAIPCATQLIRAGFGGNAKW